MTAVLNKVLLANCRADEGMQDVDEETKHDHDRHQMKSNRDLEETPIFELTVTFDGYHKPVVYPLQDVKAIFHAYPSLEESSEVS